MAANERGEKERGPVRDKPNSDPNSPITDEGGSEVDRGASGVSVDRRWIGERAAPRGRGHLSGSSDPVKPPAIRSNLHRSGQISSDPVTSPPIRSHLHRSSHSHGREEQNRERKEEEREEQNRRENNKKIK